MPRIGPKPPSMPKTNPTKPKPAPKKPTTPKKPSTPAHKPAWKPGTGKPGKPVE